MLPSGSTASAISVSCKHIARFPEGSGFLLNGEGDDRNATCFDTRSILGKVINSVLSYVLG